MPCAGCPRCPDHKETYSSGPTRIQSAADPGTKIQTTSRTGRAVARDSDGHHLAHKSRPPCESVIQSTNVIVNLVSATASGGTSVQGSQFMRSRLFVNHVSTANCTQQTQESAHDDRTPTEAKLASVVYVARDADLHRLSSNLHRETHSNNRRWKAHSTSVLSEVPQTVQDDLSP